jgi:hypothetical protein
MAVAPGPVTGATPSTSPRRTPAVGGERRAGDVAGVRGRREGDDARDLLDSGGLAELNYLTYLRHTKVMAVCPAGFAAECAGWVGVVLVEVSARQRHHVPRR